MDLWHAYGTIDDGKHVLLIVGPVSDDDSRNDGQQWEDPYLTTGPYSNEPVNFDFITSFDHEPSEGERFHLVPEEHRKAYIEGLTAELVNSQSSLEDLEFSEEELRAISLAVQFRITDLQEIADRRRVVGSVLDLKTIKACEDQIDALLTFSDKLDLKAKYWDDEND